MRILHLIHSAGVYGAEAVLLYLAREQRACGHEPVIGSIRNPGTAQTPFEARASSWGLAVAPISIPPRRPTPGVMRTMLHAVRDVAPDVLHSHGYKANILLGPLPRRWRGPMVTTLHGWTAPRLLSALWLYERLDQFCLRRIDSIVVVARHMLRLPALRHIPSSRTQVIENGIPSLSERLADLAARDCAPLPGELVDFVARRPTLVAIGRLSPEKGFLLLLEAFSRARLTGAAEAQLVIVGEGPERAQLAQRIPELALAGCVRLAGYVDGADRLLQHAHGFVMSSLTEGLPLVLLEAMQWSVPILATAVGAIPDLLAEQGGLLVPPNDVEALAGGITRLLAADAPRTVLADARAASETYTSVAMARRYLDVYRAIREVAGQGASEGGRV